MGNQDTVSSGDRYRFTDHPEHEFAGLVGKTMTVNAVHTDEDGRDVVTVEHDDVSEDEMNVETVSLNVFQNIVSSDRVESVE